MWGSQLPALPEERERERREEQRAGPPPAHSCLRSQPSVSWGCGLCVWEARSGRWAGPARLQQPAPGTAAAGSTPPVQGWRLAWTDLPSVRPVSQHPAAKGSVEPVLPMAQPPALARPCRDSERDTGICPLPSHPPQGRLWTRQLF